ncbi:MAG: hypothetical protein AB7G44_12805 [Bacteroidia bacterium]
MKHRGEILRLRIEQSGIAKTVICKSLDIWENTLTNWCSTENLGWEKLLMVGEIIAYDFSEDFPQIMHLKYNRKEEILYVSEPVEAYKMATSESIETLVQTVTELKKDLKKALQLLEKLISSKPQ